MMLESEKWLWRQMATVNAQPNQAEGSTIKPETNRFRMLLALDVWPGTLYFIRRLSELVRNAKVNFPTVSSPELRH